MRIFPTNSARLQLGVLLMLLLPHYPAVAEKDRLALVLDSSSRLHTGFEAALGRQFGITLDNGKEVSIEKIHLDSDTSAPLQIPRSEERR